jgi:hypothetical protein
VQADDVACDYLSYSIVLSEGEKPIHEELGRERLREKPMDALMVR